MEINNNVIEKIPSASECSSPSNSQWSSGSEQQTEFQSQVYCLIFHFLAAVLIAHFLTSHSCIHVI